MEDFFARGKETARLLDQKKPLTPRRIISFEDPEDLMMFLTKNKLKLIASLRKKPNSMSGLAKLLKRSRAALDKDIHLLESIGLVKSEYIANPGHGKHKVITAIDKSPVKLQVQTSI
jgi:predicted transcriptional regulator